MVGEAMSRVDKVRARARFLVVAMSILAGVASPVAEGFADWRETTTSIKDQIAMLQPPIGPHSMDIEYMGRGEVRLSGVVASEDARARAGEVAARTAGVSKVDNDLAVSPSGRRYEEPPRRGERVESQAEVAQIKQALRDKVTEGRYVITIESFPESVVIRGTAENLPTKEQIHRVTSSISRRTVIDYVEVRPFETDAAIKESIERMLESEYPRLIRDLDVRVADGVATIRGDAASRRDVDKVLSSVLMVQGVGDVRSELTVGRRPYTRR